MRNRKNREGVKVKKVEMTDVSEVLHLGQKIKAGTCIKLQTRMFVALT